jgi:hypothetical protein
MLRNRLDEAMVEGAAGIAGASVTGGLAACIIIGETAAHPDVIGAVLFGMLVSLASWTLGLLAACAVESYHNSES